MTIMTMHQRPLSLKLRPLHDRLHIKSIKSAQQQAMTVTLDMLPLDVILYICDFLPPTSMAAFSIASKRLYGSLGNKHLTLLKPENMREEKLSLLTLLKRDLRAQYLCWRCEQFHPITTCPAVDLGHSGSSMPQCVQQDGILEFDIFRGMHFRHVHALMTRVRHRWPYERELISLTFQYEKQIHCCLDEGEEHTAKLKTSVLPVIHQEELLLHVSITLYMAECCELEKFRGEFPKICPHCHPTFFPFFGREDPIQIVAKRIEYAEKVKKSATEYSRRTLCAWCKTWFFVRASVSNGSMLKRQKRIRVDLDIWKNLGACIRPDDPTWSSHCLELEIPRERLR